MTQREQAGSTKAEPTRRTRRQGKHMTSQDAGLEQENLVDIDREREAKNWERVLELAGDAALEGLTRQQVITALAQRIDRDTHYLAYRHACRRRTSYDRQVEADMRAIALAACWLHEGKPASA